MRQAYVHDAILVPAPGSGDGAPGAAITTALGSGAHDTVTTPDGDRLHLRIVFAAAPDQVDGLRERIDAALAAGDWKLVSSGCARMAAGDRDRARRLLRSGQPAG